MDRVDELSKRLDDFRSDFTARFELIDRRFELIDRRFADLNAKMERHFHWMIGTMIALFAVAVPLWTVVTGVTVKFLFHLP